MLDLVIVGAGPSALAAAIYASRGGMKVQVYEKQMFGGLIATSDWVENYPGFDGISGMELASKMRNQAEKTGAKINYGEVSNIREYDEFVEFSVDGKINKARFVLLAVGNSYRKLGLKHESNLIGRGIHFCATCDGGLYRDKDIVVVGGGDSAVQETIFLTKFAKKIHMLVRSEFRAQDVLLKRLEKFVESGQVIIHKKAQISEILIDESINIQKVVGVKISQNETEEELKISGIFEFIGLIPNTAFLKDGDIALNSNNEIIVDNKMKTNKKRIFACGDVIENAEKQVAVAVGSGVIASLEISKLYNLR